MGVGGHWVWLEGPRLPVGCLCDPEDSHIAIPQVCVLFQACAKHCINVIQ